MRSKKRAIVNPDYHQECWNVKTYPSHRKDLLLIYADFAMRWPDASSQIRSCVCGAELHYENPNNSHPIHRQLHRDSLPGRRATETRLCGLPLSTGESLRLKKKRRAEQGKRRERSPCVVWSGCSCSKALQKKAASCGRRLGFHYSFSLDKTSPDRTYGGFADCSRGRKVRAGSKTLLPTVGLASGLLVEN
jgi:hypothetical protein